MLISKQMFEILATGYIDQYLRDSRIDDVLSKENIFFTNDNNPLIQATESFFDLIDPFLTDMLLQLADLDLTNNEKLGLTDKDNKIHFIDTVSGLYDFYFS